MSILDYVPEGWTLRKEQHDLLVAIEKDWTSYDVFTVTAPTAVGKSLIAYVIAKWQEAKRKTVNIMPPTNVLVDQISASFPDLTVLHRKAAYSCEPFKRTCDVTAERCKQYCPDCPYIEAKAAARRAKIRLCNPYIAWSHKAHGKIAIFDEAHTLLEMLEDKKDVKLWQHEYPFPDDLHLVSDVISWGQKHLADNPDNRLNQAIIQMTAIRDGATVEYKASEYRDKPTKLLHIMPSTTKAVPPWLWPVGKVEKIVLLSATIGPKDIVELGLAKKRVLYLTCSSPIPAANRPFIFSGRCNMAMKHRDMALPYFAEAVAELLAKHPEKGLIHLPYSLVDGFAALVTDPRFMFHTKTNKQQVLEAFRTSPVEAGRILVASGLYEGVDLPYDAARWQVIGCVPYMSLGDERIKSKMEADPDGYDWNTIRRILQATGRIVRATDDTGTTYMFDTNFSRLWHKDTRRKPPMFPDYFRDALQGIK